MAPLPAEALFVIAFAPLLTMVSVTRHNVDLVDAIVESTLASLALGLLGVIGVSKWTQWLSLIHI